jgi:glycosyltransferase involved in cell wall biosynthesis
MDFPAGKILSSKGSRAALGRKKPATGAGKKADVPLTVIRGQVTNVVPGVIEGWVVNANDPAEKLTIECLADGELVYETVANIFRPDLRDYGLNDCYHGFRIAFDPDKYPIESLRIIARSAEEVSEVFGIVQDPPSQGRTGARGLPVPEERARTEPIDIFFDVSDLVNFFKDYRFPTGIQRVQMEIIRSFFGRTTESLNVSVCAFVQDRDFWVEIPLSFFNHVCMMSIAADDEKWQETLTGLNDLLREMPYVGFTKGAYLVDLGSSWWLRNLFLKIRHAKKLYDIKYIPFIHDVIPVRLPEFCVKRLVQDYLSWLNGIFDHADHFLCNSNYTQSDFCNVAAHLDRKITTPPSVIMLDGDFRSLSEILPEEGGVGKGEGGADKIKEILEKLGVREGQYTLFVSTIEPRKNHNLVFSAWLRLIRERGLGAVPHLLCVGKSGWLNEAIYAQVMASDLLKQKVIFLSNLSDVELSYLYSHAMFTIYPSGYEGWGLPVTESLCYGKVPIISNRTSLPEAGGDFAEYFDPDSLKELVEKIRKVAFDDAYRTARENYIREHFRPRSWQEIADDIIDVLRRHKVRTPPSPQPWPWLKEAVSGQYYFMGSIEMDRPLKGIVTGEAFRQGDGWWWPEPWGCWTKKTPARLEFSYQPKGERVRLYLGLKGFHKCESAATVTIDGAYRRTVSIGLDGVKWIIFYLDPDMMAVMPRHEDRVLIGVTIGSSDHVDFSEDTDGGDTRIAGVGIIGFMVCDESDIKGRLNLLEKIAIDDRTADLHYAEFRSPLI